jgi:hypothetical protein
MVQTGGSNVPFLPRSDAPHTVQLVQYRLQARQDRAIKLDGEWPLQARLMLRLFEQILQLKEFNLQVQFPEEKRSSQRLRHHTRDGDYHRTSP